MGQQTLVDPKVTRRKFDKEVVDLMRLAPDLRKKGWIIESTTFPIVRVTFITNHIFPPLAPVTVDIDFTNYNVEPPSVRLLHPVDFSKGFVKGIQKEGNEKREVVRYVHPSTKQPFLCLPGVREYHSHPQHSGDSWDLHRYTGAGNLHFILEYIWLYCIKSITGMIVPQLVINPLRINWGRPDEKDQVQPGQ